MASVSEQLRQAREDRKLTVQQVAEMTKIRSDHLRALESADYDVFSAPVYIRGFVRTYATLLKLNVPGVLSDLDEELSKTRRFAEPAPLLPGGNGILDRLMLLFARVDWRKSVAFLGVLVVFVVIVAISVAVKHRRAHDPLSGIKPAIYQPSTQAVTGNTLPLPTAPQPKR